MNTCDERFACCQAHTIFYQPSSHTLPLKTCAAQDPHSIPRIVLRAMLSFRAYARGHRKARTTHAIDMVTRDYKYSVTS